MQQLSAGTAIGHKFAIPNMSTDNSNGYVRSHTEGGIATVTFHHPKSNSLPGQVLRDMAQAISDAGSDPAVRVIILRSDGDKVFCAGASFDELVSINDIPTGTTFFSGFAAVINAIRKAPVFVIGRIHGHAVGGGVGLACAVDIAYALESASVRLSELAIGIGPFVVGPAVERKTGTGTFGLLTATPATRRSAQWAEVHGIYAEVLPTIAELDARIDAHARELAGYSAEAMAELKKVMWKGTEDWDTLLAERAQQSGRLVLSDATRQAIAAFKAAAAGR